MHGPMNITFSSNFLQTFRDNLLGPIFRLPPWSRWELPSFELLRSK